MSNPDLDVLRQVQQWLGEAHAGSRVVMGTVTRTWGSAPRPVGSIVAARAPTRPSAAHAWASTSG